MNEQRPVGIVKDAKDFREYGYTPLSPVEDPILREVAPESPEAYQLFSDIKPELYARLSGIIDDTMNHAVSQRAERGPFGLIQKFPSNVIYRLDEAYPFYHMRECMDSTLEYSSEAMRRRFESGETSFEFDQNYRRVNQIVRKLAGILEERKKADTTEKLTNTGIHTASSTMSGILSLVPNFADGHDETIALAENSYPVVTQLAKMQGIVAVNFIEAPDKDGKVRLPLFDYFPHYFEVKERGGKSFLDFSPAGIAALRKIERLFFQIYKEKGLAPEPLVTCPALVNFGDGSAIKKMWEWHLDIARQIYPSQVT